MRFHHVHFYVEALSQWQQWFEQVLGFRTISHFYQQGDHTAILRQGSIEIRLSAPEDNISLSQNSPIAAYLRNHPEGIGDVAFAVEHLESTLERALANGAKLLKPVTSFVEGVGRWCQISGWGHLTHSLIEQSEHDRTAFTHKEFLTCVDHVVLNVEAGQRLAAQDWYQNVLGFYPQQSFDITTANSGLCSQVMAHSNGAVLFPINEPTSANSQIQEFLEHNRGSGIQHVALSCDRIVEAIAQFRQRGLNLLTVPTTYYEDLKRRPGYQDDALDWQAVARQHILVDWPANTPNALLLQTFTAPIFETPTFFFEFIQRRAYLHNGALKVAKGFGEGNFQALFEAIERDQLIRGSL